MRNANYTSAIYLSEKDDSKLRELFLKYLRDIFWVEKLQVKTLPKLVQASATEDLKDTFQIHLIETEDHVCRVMRVFDMMGEKAQAKQCLPIEGLFEEGDELIHLTEEGSLGRDCGLIMTAQKLEHYEIASYTTLRNIARLMGNADAAKILQSIIDEEGIANNKLTMLMQSHINH